jgi:hypothetical protein
VRGVFEGQSNTGLFALNVLVFPAYLPLTTLPQSFLLILCYATEPPTFMLLQYRPSVVALRFTECRVRVFISSPLYLKEIRFEKPACRPTILTECFRGFSFGPGKCRPSTFNFDTSAFFYIFSSLLFINHPIIRRYLV